MNKSKRLLLRAHLCCSVAFYASSSFANASLLVELEAAKEVEAAKNREKLLKEVNIDSLTAVPVETEFGRILNEKMNEGTSGTFLRPKLIDPAN
jgi:hypothetical protein